MRLCLILTGLLACFSPSVFAEEAAKADDAAAAAAVQPAPDEAELANWIELTFGGFSVNGNDAAFQRRTGNYGGFYGGIKSFFFEKTEDDATFTVDGHALFALQDFEVNLNYEKLDVGFVRGGFKQFRTWYDGSGGFVPGAAAPAGWIDRITEFDDELSLERGKIWIEAGLRVENLPEITFGYSHSWRDGTKDSMFWASYPTATAYRVAPAFYHIDETRDNFSLDVVHTLGKTELGMGLNYEIVRNQMTDDEEEGEIINHAVTDSSLFGASMFSTTRFNERNWLSFGYLFTSLDTDINGSSRFVDPSLGNNEVGHSYPYLLGGSEFNQHVINGNYWWKPVDDLVVVPSIRVERQKSGGYSSGLLDGPYAGVAGSVPPAPLTNGASTMADRLFRNETEVEGITEGIELRYSGFDNLLLYTSAELSQSDQDLNLYLLRQKAAGAAPLTNEWWRFSKLPTDSEKYTIGGNWYATQGLTVATQYYYKLYDADFANRLATVGGNIASPSLDAMFYSHASDTHDANIRLSWRALSNLSFVTRYDYQQSQIKNQGYYNTATTLTTGVIDSADIDRHMLSESVTWNATERFYVQGSVFWVDSTTHTPASMSPNGVPMNFIPDWENDYWMAMANAGYAIDSKTDIVGGYSFYGARTFQGASGITGYGFNTDEHMINVTLNRMLNPRTFWNLSYGYITSDSGPAQDQTGGFNDFEAHMVSTGLQIRF